MDAGEPSTKRARNSISAVTVETVAIADAPSFPATVVKAINTKVRFAICTSLSRAN
jgi:hypothetical protein